jgi:hypothetical protein
MSSLGLTSVELEQIVRSCRWIRLRSPAPFDLRAFLIVRLKATSPEIAHRVEKLSVAQMDRLCQEIVHCQAPLW